MLQVLYETGVGNLSWKKHGERQLILGDSCVTPLKVESEDRLCLGQCESNLFNPGRICAVKKIFFQTDSYLTFYCLDYTIISCLVHSVLWANQRLMQPCKCFIRCNCALLIWTIWLFTVTVAFSLLSGIISTHCHWNKTCLWNCDEVCWMKITAFLYICHWM